MMRCMILSASLCITSVIFTASLYAESEGGEAGGFERLEQVRRQMEDTQNDLDLVRVDYDRQQAEVKKLGAAIKTLGDKEASLRKELGKVETSQKETIRMLSEIQGKISELESLSLKRVKALYMLGVRNVGVVEVKEARNFDQASVYALKVRQFDRALVQNLGDLKVRHNSETGKLTKLKDEQSKLLGKISQQKGEISTRLLTQKEALEELSRKKKALDSLLVSLKAQSLRLETVLKGLTGGEEETAGSKGGSDISKGAKLVGFNGDGFPSRSFLQPPLKGAKVIQRFGKYRAEGIGESFRKGVELAGKGQISTVDEGRVAFVGKMPQIGAVVIVDHGKRDYTLYGRLGSASVKVGDVLDAGTALGEAGSPDEQGRSLYFEVRRGGTPIDPEDFFGRKLLGK